MTKIYLDEITLKNHVYENLKNTITILKGAKSSVKSLNIPSDFKYRNYLKKLDDSIAQELNSLNAIYNMINDHCDMYSKVNNNINFELDSIENYNISLRKPAIK